MTVITRRAALAGIVSLSATAAQGTPQTPSDMTWLICEWSAAEAAFFEASAAEQRLNDAHPDLGNHWPEVESPWARLRFGLAIDDIYGRQCDAIRAAFGPEGEPAIVALDRLRLLNRQQLEAATAAHEARREAAGLAEAAAKADAASDRLDAAWQALITYRPQSLAELAERDALLLDYCTHYPRDHRLGARELAPLFGGKAA